jgi:hypothetical protein
VRLVQRALSAAGRLPGGVLRLGLLCLFIVLVGMIRPRISQEAAVWLLIGAGLLTLAGAAAVYVATRQVASHLPLMAGSFRVVDAILVLVRRTGLPLLALAFFLFWTFVYLGIWRFQSEQAFVGLGDSDDPRFADFFYYAVMTAFTSPPEGIAPLSRGARSATMIEVVTAWRCSPRTSRAWSSTAARNAVARPRRQSDRARRVLQPELEVRNAGQVEPDAVATAADGPHEDTVAAGATHHGTHCVDVRAQRPDLGSRSTARAAGACGRHVDGEDLAEEPPDRVAVQHELLHG